MTFFFSSSRSKDDESRSKLWNSDACMKGTQSRREKNTLPKGGRGIRSAIDHMAGEFSEPEHPCGSHVRCVTLAGVHLADLLNRPFLLVRSSLFDVPLNRSDPL
uniref:Uncharacterized protein n=1 Tax=Grammatophora oceanica TaxID=210454 RepID=A0A7S1UQ39_9STRA